MIVWLAHEISDTLRGFAPARPHLIEEFARVLEINRDLLYLAADIVPPEVAEELRRLTPEEREMAWGAFKKVVADAQAERNRREEHVVVPTLLTWPYSALVHDPHRVGEVWRR